MSAHVEASVEFLQHVSGVVESFFFDLELGQRFCCAQIVGLLAVTSATRFTRFSVYVASQRCCVFAVHSQFFFDVGP